MHIGIEDILRARQNLLGITHQTNLIYSQTFSEISGNNVFLKTENLQKTGSFKIRGAYNKIANLSKEEKQRGVIASSAGNHAQGVALAASIYGIKSTIVMPSAAPLSKVSATSSYGADVILWGAVYDDCYEKAIDIQVNTGAIFVHPFDDPFVIAGQGTIALEVLDELPNTDIIIVPIGGGGIISGIAIAAKELNPNITIIGVESKNADSMYRSIKEGKIICLENSNSIADGIAVKKPGKLTYDICKKYIDDIIRVDEDEIACAMVMLLERCKLVSEGAGAASVVPLLNGKLPSSGKNIVPIISGGNIDVTLLSRIIDKGLVKAGRKFGLKVIMEDRPGQLKKLLETISSTTANIVSIEQNRIKEYIAVGYVEIELIVESLNKSHIEEIIGVLKNAGYKIIL